MSGTKYCMNKVAFSPLFEPLKEQLDLVSFEREDSLMLLGQLQLMLLSHDNTLSERV